ncbi:MAG: sigma-70 family RNA polymerase sigma factor [Planctomycetota bacterium]
MFIIQTPRRFAFAPSLGGRGEQRAVSHVADSRDPRRLLSALPARLRAVIGPRAQKLIDSGEVIVINAGSAEATLPSPKDPWVIRLTSSGETRDAALSELREVLLRGMSKLMSSRYGGGYSAEDAVQVALIKIMDSLDQFAGRSRFITWAMTVATRVGISEMRRKHYHDVSIESFASDGASFEVAAEVDVTASAELDRVSMIVKLQKLIDETLSEKQRFAIRSSLAGLPVEVIAEKTGSNRNSVYKLVHDARVKLRSGLEANGISADLLAAVFA